MRMSVITVVVAILTSQPLLAVADSAALKMSDFAYGAEITAADSEFIRFPLTPNIIKTIERDDLGDIRVYDSNNEPMPSLARKKDGLIKTAQQSLAVTPTRSSGKTTSYLIDRTSHHDAALNSLLLHWRRGREPKVLALQVEHSADKKTWQTLAKPGTIVNFNFEGVLLDQNYIDINRYSERYIRLSFPESSHPPVIASVTAYTTNKPVSDYWWIHAGKLEASVKPSNAYRFSLSQGIRPVSLKFLFPQINSILSGSLYRIDTSNGKPQQQLVEKNFTAYTVTLNSSVASSRGIDISQQYSPDWLITADTAKNIQPDNLPGVLAGYLQYEVIFASDGEAPYTAVWGNARVSAPPAGVLLERLKAVTRPDQSISDARTGAVMDNQTLTELMESREFSWLSLLLWLMLAAIAALSLRAGYQQYRSAKTRSI